MDDACCLRALLSICIYMAHNIVADQFFTLLGNIVIDIIHMCLKLIDLLLCDNRLTVLGKS